MTAGYVAAAGDLQKEGEGTGSAGRKTAAGSVPAAASGSRAVGWEEASDMR